MLWAICMWCQIKFVFAPVVPAIFPSLLHPPFAALPPHPLFASIFPQCRSNFCGSSRLQQVELDFRSRHMCVACRLLPAACCSHLTWPDGAWHISTPLMKTAATTTTRKEAGKSDNCQWNRIRCQRQTKQTAWAEAKYWRKKQPYRERKTQWEN